MPRPYSFLSLSSVAFLKIYIISSDMVSRLSPGTELRDHGPEINRVAAIFTALGTLAVVARLFSRKLQRSNLHASDYSIMLGLLVAWGQAALVFIGYLILPFDQLILLRHVSRCFLWTW